MLAGLTSLVGGYLVGAIPFGFLLGRLRGVDIREYGSGSMGTANVYRTLGYRAGFTVFLLDLGKGGGAVLLAQALFHSSLASALAGLAVMVGHNWSVFLRFQGGRGVMPFFGGLLALAWPVALISGALALGTIALSRYVSLGSILGVSSSTLIMLVWKAGEDFSWRFLLFTIGGSLLILFQHRENIARLISGKERQLGSKAERRGSPN